MKVLTGKTYKVTRADGGGFTMHVDRVRDRWVYGRTSGGYIGSILASNIRGAQEEKGPTFTFTELAE